MDEQWDFLRDIVSKVEIYDKGGKGGGFKVESDSDDDEFKKKKGGRKRKIGQRMIELEVCVMVDFCLV